MAFSATTRLAWLLLTSTFMSTATSAALITSPGQIAPVPWWKVQSSANVGNDAAKLSSASFDASTWYTIGSKATLMATLLENNVYNDTSLFFSENLKKIDHAPFQVPWFYRSDIDLEIRPNSSYSTANATEYFQLKTHGISSRADIYINGALVADKNTQAGAYGGLTYDITPHVKSGKNVLLIRAYPTDYNRDFALGFVDWNPYPPDNGTGVWRDVEVKTTGAASLDGVRVNAKLDGSISINVGVKSWDDRGVEGEVVCTVHDPQKKEVGRPRTAVKIAGEAQKKITLDVKIANPQIWWPKQWGEQPLYTTICSISTSSGISDTTPPTRFGIRTVTSTLNDHKDITFTINTLPFQVLGAGYTSDIFLRFSASKLRAQFQLVLDMGLNTVRLEGKQEHPYLYDLADEMGIMLLTGWECCDKWEGWTYNNEGSGITFTDPDYAIANTSMRHEAEMMQHHPSLLGFLIGSDFWPDDRATGIYVDALRAYDWDVPIIASASQRGYPALLGNGGMKMEGPYDWVPPSYWYGDRLGAAFGFGSELGAGVGTPELSSLKRFLSRDDIDDLWKNPNKGLYHMSTSVSSFYTREIYNGALWARYGAPASVEDYLVKAQMSDYEATRAQFEAFACRWTGVERPATGLVYWMLNNAWPSLHWNLFDYYLHTAGAFFGAKTAARAEHVVYDYASHALYLINRSRGSKGVRTVDVELISTTGEVLGRTNITAQTSPNSSQKIAEIPTLIAKIKDVAFLRLILRNQGEESSVLSRNVYWLSSQPEVLDWENSTWYHTPVSLYANFTALDKMEKAQLNVTVSGRGKLLLENESTVPAVFIRLNLVDAAGRDVVPAFWSDNYVTLWPGESMEIEVRFEESMDGRS